MKPKVNSEVTSNPIGNYNSIDTIKFICSILIFMIHIPPLCAPFDGTLSAGATLVNFWLQKYICRLAVPFYFVCSGFFLFRKMPRDAVDVERVKNYCFRILRLLGTWSILLFMGGDVQLWYLGSTVLAVTLLSLCLHFRMKDMFIIILACVLFIIGLFRDSYFGFIEPLTTHEILRYFFAAWGLGTNVFIRGVFMGFIFVLMGMLFAKKNIHLNTRLSLIGFVVSMVCLGGEVFTLDYYGIPFDHTMYIFLLPATFFLFAFATSLSLKDRPVYARLRTIGLLVYFLHLFVSKFINLVAKGLYIVLGLNIHSFFFPIALVSTLLVAVCIERLSRKDRFKWIKSMFL